MNALPSPRPSALYLYRAVVFALGTIAAGWAMAQSTPPAGGADPVLLDNGIARVMRSDYERELLRLPPDARAGFANSEKRVNDLVRRILLDKTLAEQALVEKLPEAPAYASRYRAELERTLATLKLLQVEDAARAEFDAKLPQWEARARELYTVDRKKYEAPEQVAASHILFKTESRSSEEAQARAREARERVLAGADFYATARELSDDRSARANDGRLGYFTRAEMDPKFSEAAFAMKSVGEISQPVQSSFGWHVIKLEGRRSAAVRPFEEVREPIINELRQRYITDRREAWIGAIRTNPAIRADAAAIDALVIRVDRDSIRRSVNEIVPGAMAPPKQ